MQGNKLYLATNDFYTYYNSITTIEQIWNATDHHHYSLQCTQLVYSHLEHE